MAQRNIAAWTPTEGPYPPFVSVNEIASGMFELHVRGRTKDGRCGDQASVVLTQSQAKSIARQITDALSEDSAR